MGTSMASPHIAGVAALIVGEGVERKPDVVLQILTETARAPSGLENDKPKDYAEHYGAGIVDASKAVQRAHSIGGGSGHKIKTIVYVLLLLVFLVIVLVKRKKK
jgi:serine protease